MIPNTLNLPTIWRGCDWGPVTLKWKDRNGLPLDVRAWTPKANSLHVNLNAQKVSNGIHGETKMVLTKAETANLKLGVEKWDWIWQSNDTRYRFPPFLAGKITIKDPVTSLGTDTPPSGPQLPDAPAEPPPITGPIESTEVTHDPPIP